MRTTSLSSLTHLIVLTVAMMTCGFIALFLGKELQWDLAAYHYYNPYAFLHQRWQLDYWPADQIQAFINPTIDYLTYFLITYLPPKAASFILGAIQGINVWLLFILSYLFIRQYEIKFCLFASIFLAMIGMYGPISLGEIGSFMGDNIVSLFVLAALVLQTVYWQDSNKRSLFCSGMLLGIATGLKLTAAFYVVGAFLAIILLPISFSTKRRIIVSWGLGVGLGFMLFAGYWMSFLWQRYHNPVFPFLNRLFHSTEFLPVNFYDERFHAKTLLQSLFFPFYFSADGGSEYRYTDYRLPILYILLVISFIKYLWQPKIQVDVARRWLILFAFFSYITWQFYFSIPRYLVALQMVSPLLIYLLIIYLLPTASYRHSITKPLLLMALFAFIALTMSPIKTARTRTFGDNYFNIHIPRELNKRENATVLVAYPSLVGHSIPQPQTYLIPFLPKQWRFLGVGFTKDMNCTLSNEVRTIVKNTPGPFYILTNKDVVPLFYAAIHELGLVKEGKCHVINTDRDPHGAWLCNVKRLNQDR